MQLTCPVCSARYALEAALHDEAARHAVAAALALPAPLGDHLLRYVGLFRPAKRALGWPRVGRLLDELLALIEGGTVERRGRRVAVSVETWAAALEQMLARRDRLDLPLAGHGYLLDVVASQAERANEAQAARTRPLHASHRSDAGPSAGPRSMADVVAERRRREWDAQLGIGGSDDDTGD